MFQHNWIPNSKLQKYKRASLNAYLLPSHNLIALISRNIHTWELSKAPINNQLTGYIYQHSYLLAQRSRKTPQSLTNHRRLNIISQNEHSDRYNIPLSVGFEWPGM